MIGRNTNRYPHYVAEVWGGRLATPLEYRGTGVAKLFEQGKIGGRKIVESQEFPDTEQGRKDLQAFLRRHREANVYRLISPRHSRQPLGTRATMGACFVKHGFRG